MEDSLSQAFRSLRSPAGKPDPQARKVALVSFVKGGHLDVNELRLLKELLAPVSLQKDIVTSLPVELVLLITDLLSERDIWSCLTVSHAWSATLMSDRVVFSLADQHFPQIAWKASKRATQDGNARGDLRIQFLHHLRKRMALMDSSVPGTPPMLHKDYLWDSEAEFKLQGQAYSDFPLPNLPSNQRAMYAHGRIAWQPETHTIVVDNLRNKKRTIHTYPRGKLWGPEMKLVALGDRLVVATIDRFIFAWDIETNTVERKSLSRLVSRCTTSGTRVATIIDNDIHTWQIGGPLLEMTLPDLDTKLSSAGQFPVAFAHPHSEDVLFVRRVYRSSSSTLRFLVHKIVNMKLIETFEHDVEMSWLPNEWLQSSLVGFMPLSYEWDARNQGYHLHEFDMYHEKFTRRNVTHFGRRKQGTFMFTFDDDFAVELSERHYEVW